MSTVTPIGERLSPRFGGLSGGSLFLFGLLALLQVLGVCLALEADPAEPFSLLIAFAAVAPFLVLAILISPPAVLLSTPLLIIIPGTVMGFAPFEWVFLAALLGAVVRSGASGAHPGPLNWLEVVFGAYVMWAAVTVTQAVEFRPAIEGMKQLIMSFLFFLVGSRIIGRSGARNLLRVLCILAVFIALQLTIVILVKGFSVDLLLTRILALTDLSWGQSNYIAAIAALTTCAAVALILFGREWEKLLGFMGIIGSLFVQVVTMSRGGIVALLGGLLLAAVLAGRRRILPAITLAATMLVVIILTPLGQALVSRFASQTGIQSVGVRFLYYTETLAIARSNWFLGIGPGQIPYHSAFYVDKNPHNFVLKNLADLGIIGLLLFLALMVLAARNAMTIRRTARTTEDRILSLSLILALGVGIVNASYEPTLTGASYALVFWLMVGALTCPLRPGKPV